MVAQRFYDELFALPRADQAEVLDRLTQHLTATAGPEALSEDVRRLLDERRAEFERDPSAALTWEQAMQRVAERLSRQ